MSYILQAIVQNFSDRSCDGLRLLRRHAFGLQTPDQSQRVDKKRAVSVRFDQLRNLPAYESVSAVARRGRRIEVSSEAGEAKRRFGTGLKHPLAERHGFASNLSGRADNRSGVHWREEERGGEQTWMAEGR